MITLLDTKFWQVYYNPEIDIFEIHWKKSEDEISDEEFKTHLLSYVNFFKDYSVKGFYVDTRASHILMSVEIQQWHDEYIVPQYIAAKLEKIAFVMPQEYVTALSIELTFDEQKAQALNVKYFSDETEARNWLNN